MKSIIPNALTARKLTASQTERRLKAEAAAEKKALERELERAIQEEREKEALIVASTNVFMKENVAPLITAAVKKEHCYCSFAAPRSEDVKDRVQFSLEKSGYSVKREYKETPHGEECYFKLVW